MPQYTEKPQTGFLGVNIRTARTGMPETDVARAVNVDFNREVGTASIRHGSTSLATLTENLVRFIAKVNNRRYYVAAQRLYRDGTEISLKPQQLDSSLITDIDGMRPLNDETLWAFNADIGNRKQLDDLGRGHSAMVKDALDGKNGNVTRKWGIAPPPETPTIHAIDDSTHFGKLDCGIFKWFQTHIRWTAPIETNILPAVAHEGNPINRSATIISCPGLNDIICPASQNLKVDQEYIPSGTPASNRASWGGFVDSSGVTYLLHGIGSCGGGNMNYDTCTTLTKFNADGSSSTVTKVPPIDSNAAVNIVSGQGDEHAYMFTTGGQHLYHSIPRNVRIVLQGTSSGIAAGPWVKRGDRLWMVEDSDLIVNNLQRLVEWDINFTGFVKTAIRSMDISSMGGVTSLTATDNSFFLGTLNSKIVRVSKSGFAVTKDFGIPVIGGITPVPRGMWAVNDNLVYFSHLRLGSPNLLDIYALVNDAFIAIATGIPTLTNVWCQTGALQVPGWPIIISGKSFYEQGAVPNSGGDPFIRRMGFTCP